MRESHLHKIELVENAFGALASACGHSSIAATSDDLHGDAIFCEKEIDVVLPDRELLGVLDPGGIERLRDGGLVLANMQSHPKSGVGFLDHQLHRFLLSTPRGVSRSDISHFVLRTVEDIREVRFVGMAFDGTTDSGLYASDGFVVSNCRCSLDLRTAEG
jgi:hypothetical protein